MKSLEDKCDKLASAIGNIVFENYSLGGEYPENITEICREIQLVKLEINGKKALIVKNKSDMDKSYMACPKCGTRVTTDTKFCYKCGTKIGSDNIMCAQCGKELAAGALFCDQCRSCLHWRKSNANYQAYRIKHSF